MEDFKKLKSPKLMGALLLPAAIIIVLTAIFFTFGLMGFLIVLVCWLVGLIFYVGLFLMRTKNPAYIVVILSLVSSALFIWMLIIQKIMLIPFLALLTLFFTGVQLYLYFTKKLKWREREVLELAAYSVHENADGFTSRPLPAGSVNYSVNELARFAQFLLRYLIAMPYFENDKVVFALTGKIYKHMLNLNQGYQKNSWIAFYFNGKVIVNITQETYARYKDELTFDQLCLALSELFKQFFEMYKKGEGHTIIDRMDELKEKVWAEA